MESKLMELAKSHPNITVSVTIADLMEFHKDVIADTKKELEDAIVADNEERYLSEKQVCDILDVDSSTLWRWKKKDYLSPVKIGGKNRYKKSEINRILNNDKPLKLKSAS